MKFIVATIVACLVATAYAGPDATASVDLNKILSVALVQAKNDLLLEGGKARDQLQAFVDKAHEKTGQMRQGNNDIRGVCAEIVRESKIMDQQIKATNTNIIRTLVGAYQTTLNEVVSYLQ